MAESRNVGCSLRLLLGPKCQYTVGGGGGGGGGAGGGGARGTGVMKGRSGD